MGLPDRLGESRTVAILDRSAGPLIAATAAALIMGAAGYVVPILQTPTTKAIVGVGGGGGGGGTVEFATDWGGGTGTSAAILMDSTATTPWAEMFGTATGHAIVADTFDFPTTNVYELTDDAAAVLAHFNESAGGYLDTIAVSSSRYWRYYARVVVDSTFVETPANTHGKYDGLGTAYNANLNVGHEINPGDTNNSIPGDQWQFCLNTQASGGPSVPPNSVWCAPNLNKNQTYRFEVQVLREQTDSFTLHARIYNISDVLLYDDNDFDGGVAGTLADSVAQGYNSVSGVAGFNGFSWGFNGYGGAGGLYSIHAGFAICSGDWCGAYTSGEAGN